MKKLFSVILVLIVLLAANQIVIAKAEAIAPYANPIFEIASVTFNSKFTAYFSASTNEVCSSIFVSSCVLQKKSGTSWITSAELVVPSYVATDASNYDDFKNYADVIPVGGTYRLKVVFSGGGETVTRYSNSQSK